MKAAFLAAAFAVAASLSPCAAEAQQGYPGKPVKIVAPVQPGGQSRHHHLCLAADQVGNRGADAPVGGMHGIEAGG